LFTAPPRIDAPGWAAIAFIGLASALGYWLWLWALGRTSPTRVTSWIALSPITASVLGALLLGEPLGTTFLLGLACVALGIWLAHRPA
jgi:drug/metabolite transporter (DMT)-like permease